MSGVFDSRKPLTKRVSPRGRIFVVLDECVAKFLPCWGRSAIFDHHVLVVEIVCITAIKEVTTEIFIASGDPEQVLDLVRRSPRPSRGTKFMF
jgi:hypothetical protein